MNILMTIKYLFLLSLLFFSSTLFSQDKKIPTPGSPMQSSDNVDLNKVPVDTASLDINIRNVQEKIKKEKNTDPILTTELMSFAGTFDFYARHPRIEKDTKIYSAWFKNISDTLKKMANSKQDIMLGALNKDPKLTEKSKLLYKKYSETLLTLLDKPERITGKK